MHGSTLVHHRAVYSMEVHLAWQSWFPYTAGNAKCTKSPPLCPTKYVSHHRPSQPNTSQALQIMLLYWIQLLNFP